MRRSVSQKLILSPDLADRRGGYQSSALTSLFSGPAGLWSFGGNLTSNRSSKAEEFGIASGLPRRNKQEAALIYRRTIQQAFREVSDALVAYRKSQEFRFQQEQLTRSAEDATTALEYALQGRSY